MHCTFTLIFILCIGFSFSPTPICFYPTSPSTAHQYYKVQQQPQVFTVAPQTQYVGIVKNAQGGN